MNSFFCFVFVARRGRGVGRGGGFCFCFVFLLLQNVPPFHANSPHPANKMTNNGRRKELSSSPALALIFFLKTYTFEPKKKHTKKKTRSRSRFQKSKRKKKKLATLHSNLSTSLLARRASRCSIVSSGRLSL